MTQPNLQNACPACLAPAPAPFFALGSVPVFCNVLHAGADAALAAARGDIALALCDACGMIWNTAFDPDLVRYAAGYENSLAFSPTFQRYADELAGALASRPGVRGGRIVEIGCGDGAFLASLCERAGAAGFGFDPSRPGPLRIDSGAGVEIVPEPYSGEHARRDADLICCRHVLEHIETPLEFVRSLREGVGERTPTLYFEVPNALWTIRDLGVWDVIYEHCLYFTPRALAGLFARAGFRVDRSEAVYGDQFLALECAPSPGPTPAPHAADGVGDMARRFAGAFEDKRAAWRERLGAFRDAGRRAALWGAGSKGVTFLNVLADRLDPVVAVVDINPRKHGRFVAGVGRPIVAPEGLARTGADAVIVMNPMYAQEVRATLDSLGVDAEVFTP